MTDTNKEQTTVKHSIPCRCLQSIASGILVVVGLMLFIGLGYFLYNKGVDYGRSVGIVTGIDMYRDFITKSCFLDTPKKRPRQIDGFKAQTITCYWRNND